MRYVQRVNGKVVAVSSGPAYLEDGTLLTDPEPLPEGHPELSFNPPPPWVTKRQAVQALILTGKLTSVNSALAALPGQAGELARAEWDESQVVERYRPLVISMGQTLGMTSDDLDQLFILAKGL